MQWIVSLSCPYTCDQHTHLQILSNWHSPYLRPSVGFANGISWYLTKYSSLYLNGSVCTLYCLTHTMVFTCLVHRTHILSTLLTTYNIQYWFHSGEVVPYNSRQVWTATMAVVLFPVVVDPFYVLPLCLTEASPPPSTSFGHPGTGLWSRCTACPSGTPLTPSQVPFLGTPSHWWRRCWQLLLHSQLRDYGWTCIQVCHHLCWSLQ